MGTLKRKQFTFYESYFKAIMRLKTEYHSKALSLMCRYALYGEEPEEQEWPLNLFLDLLMPNLRASRRRAKAGKLGSEARFQARGKIDKEIDIEIEKDIELENKIEAGALESPAGLVGGVENFDLFFREYPKQERREQALAVWLTKGWDLDRELQNLRAWKQSPYWLREQGIYIPYPENYLAKDKYRSLPPGYVPYGAGRLGKAELEAIEQLMRE